MMMQFEEETAELGYTVRIPNFSSYRDYDEVFKTEFPLKVNNFTSRWSLSLLPFTFNNNGYKEEEDAVNHDVGVLLECLSCNVKFPEIEVYSRVSGRDQHEKLLSKFDERELIWKDKLVPRLSLKVFRLLRDDVLTAHFRFVIKGSDMARAVGGVEGMSKDMRVLLEQGTFSDVDIVTSDGIRLPAHRAILHHRSNFLERITASRKQNLMNAYTPEPQSKCSKIDFSPSGNRYQPTTPDLGYKGKDTVPFRVETPINSTFGSLSSSYQLCSSRASSPEPTKRESLTKNTLNRMSVSSEVSSSTSEKDNSLPKSGIKSSPSKVLFRPRATPDRSSKLISPNHATLKDSPRRFTVSRRSPTPTKSPISKRTPMVKYPPTPSRNSPRRCSIASVPRMGRPPRASSPTKRSQTPGRMSISRRSITPKRSSLSKYPVGKTPSPDKRLITPVKRLSSYKVQLLRRTPLTGVSSPKRRLYGNCKEDENNVDSSADSTGCDSSSSPPGCKGTPLKELKEEDLMEWNGPFNLEGDLQRPEIKVNMTASIARPLLEWIYTGECSEMGKLSRALLVGGIRHGIQGLARACEYNLAAALKPLNAPEIIFLANKYKAHLLREAALDYAVKEAPSVTSQPMWTFLSSKAPEMVLEFSRRLAVYSQNIAKT